MYTLSYLSDLGSLYSYDVLHDSAAIFAFVLDLGDTYYHSHRLYRSGRLVARQALYQGV